MKRSDSGTYWRELKPLGQQQNQAWPLPRDFTPAPGVETKWKQNLGVEVLFFFGKRWKKDGNMILKAERCSKDNLDCVECRIIFVSHQRQQCFTECETCNLPFILVWIWPCFGHCVSSQSTNWGPHWGPPSFRHCTVSVVVDLFGMLWWSVVVRTTTKSWA